MLKKILGSASFYLGTALSLTYTVGELRERIRKVAETEKAYSARQYVLIRLARGGYNTPHGIKQMRYDYKLFDIASKFND
jgi:hypothetical protein